MQQRINVVIRTHRLLALVIAAGCLMGGCQLLPEPPATQPPPDQTADATNDATPTSVPAAAIAEPPPPEQIAIVISSGNTDNNPVVQALVEKSSGPTTRYSLDNASAPVIWDLIRQQRFNKVVVVGELAAQSIPADMSANAVYCQVLKEQPAMNKGMRGVTALPDFAQQLQHWRTNTPDLATIGAVTSSDMQLIIDDLQTAAANAGLNVVHTLVENDLQALVAFQRMVPSIDGYIFFPDTKILSPGVIQEILAYSHKHDISVLAYNQLIVNLGAQHGVTVDPEEVAAKALQLLQTGGSAKRTAPQVVKVFSASDTPETDDGQS